MNQILSTDLPQSGKKRRKQTSIHSIVIVFSVILIIFGLGLTSTGVYTCYRNFSEEQESGGSSSSSKPTITIERESASIIYIVVEHDKAIESVTYSIDGEEQSVDTDGSKNSIKEKVELPVGESTLTITAKDINGVSSSYENTYSVENVPIITLEQVDTQVLVTVESTINIDTVKYYWDDNEEEAMEYEINDTKTETYIDVIEGEHTLNIVATDIEGNEATEFQKIKGNTKPEITITTDGEVFKISITDDEEIDKVGIKLIVDGEEYDTVVERDIESTEYYTTIDVQEGENQIQVVAYDNWNLYGTLTKKFTKE